MMVMMERLEAKITGKVQLVMFRDFTLGRARRLELVGEVMNLSDGSVRVVAEGKRDALTELLTELHKGPLFARVQHVEESWLPATGEYKKFSLVSGTVAVP